MTLDNNFIDYVKIHCKSGRGGAGSTHFHRDKITSKGGPDGGDGGRGGHIILRGNTQMWTLLHLKYRKHIIAEAGHNGGSQLKTGKQGRDEILDVPLGTIAKDFETGKVICEITEHGQEAILMEGGMGGLGNWHFKSSVRQNPKHAQPGEDEKEAWCILELKVLADVGLVGKPNAGKSTFLSVVSAAKPKIADYPFTTLVPNLGVVDHRNEHSFVVADIPGIIEGASEGKGLGFRFLRHIERNSVLLFMIPVDTEDIVKEYELLRNELIQYEEHLGGKKHIVALTKADMLDEELRREMAAQLPKLDFVFISSVSGFGVEELKDKIWKVLNNLDQLDEF
ncbi:MAG: GTPase ObgE [Bacteroidetes bacterium]|nr:GTPase ObgE [Bacteroidota bacterium]